MSGVHLAFAYWPFIHQEITLPLFLKVQGDIFLLKSETEMKSIILPWALAITLESLGRLKEEETWEVIKCCLSLWISRPRELKQLLT